MDGRSLTGPFFEVPIIVDQLLTLRIVED